jgi:acyl dehydratase
MKIVERAWEDFEIGETRRSGGRTITEADVVLHAGQTGDFYPHHMDAEWCATQPFGRRIAHGTLIIAMAAGMLSDDVNPLAMSYGYDRVRFVKPVFIGDTITVEATIEARRDHPRSLTHGFVDEGCRVTKQNGEIVLAMTHVYLVQRATHQQT